MCVCVGGGGEAHGPGPYTMCSAGGGGSAAQGPWAMAALPKYLTGLGCDLITL